MNIFALPDVFLRKLMKTMEIKDRLTLRLAFRVFEELVAETDAGHFDEARFSFCDNDSSSESYLSVKIGNDCFKDIAKTEDELEPFVNLRNRIFIRICVEQVNFEVVAHTFPVDFIVKFTEKFKIGQLHFKADSESHVTKSLRLMDSFPSSKYSMTIYFHPHIELLQLLPQMEYLEIMPRSADISFIPTALFFNLLASQFDIYFSYECVEITSDEWKTGMQIFAADSLTRMAEFFLKSSTIVSCLRDYGISQSSKSGDFYDEFEVLSCEGPTNDVTVHFRHGRCWIRIIGLQWAGGDSLCSVTMETNEEWQCYATAR